tara:strand:- start:390 stop:716 length:327 start_codon:yes stop_codon:yes gene_type:complete
MDRFFNDDENNPEQFKFEDDEFGTEFDEMEEEAVAYIDKQDLLEVMHMDLAQSELHNNLMSKAISIAEKSIFWRFRSSTYKIDQIELIYDKLLNIMSDTEEGEQDADV